MFGYHDEWQSNRLKFIQQILGIRFFTNKTLLELGPYNGFFGYSLQNLGASVLLVEGRQENIDRIKEYYPSLNVVLGNLDTPEWLWGSYDIILNFGLFYHLNSYHREHLVNCINNCKLLILETIVLDNPNPELYKINEADSNDQGLSSQAKIPSTSYIENILKECNTYFIKYTDKQLNGDGHHYDWIDGSIDKTDNYNRRFWLIFTPSFYRELT